MSVGTGTPKAKKDSAARKTYAPDPHRLLPQSPDAEMGVLSSMLIDGREVCGLCAEKGVTKEHFFVPAHGTIFQAIMDRWDSDAEDEE